MSSVLSTKRNISMDEFALCTKKIFLWKRLRSSIGVSMENGVSSAVRKMTKIGQFRLSLFTGNQADQCSQGLLIIYQ